MKKFLSMTLLITAMFLMFAACSNDDDEAKKPTLSGTKWVADYGQDETLVIEFTSDTKFQEYMADKNGNVASTGVEYGTYTYSNDIVKFTTHESTSLFDSATINGNILNLTYKSGYKRSFIKK